MFTLKNLARKGLIMLNDCQHVLVWPDSSVDIKWACYVPNLDTPITMKFLRISSAILNNTIRAVLISYAKSLLSRKPRKKSEEDIPNLKFSSVPADGLAPLGAMQSKVGLKSLGKGFVVWHVRITSNTNT